MEIKKSVVVFILLISAVMLTACVYVQPPGDMPPEEPGMEELPGDMPPEEPGMEEPPGDMPPEEPGMEEPPEPMQSDKSNNPNERITMEGSVISVNDDKVVIKWPSGEKYTLRLSENTEWDPGIESWDIVPGNYLVVVVAVEGRTQGEVVRIIQHIVAE